MTEIKGRLSLVMDGETLPLDESIGLIVTELDLGWPETRAVSSPIPGQDGTDDSTRWHGARAVTLKAALLPDDEDSRLDVVRRVARYCHPRRRPKLIIDEDGHELRELVLRPDQLGVPLTSASVTEALFSWVAPSGVIRSCAERSLTVQILTSSDVPGIDFPVSFPFGFGHSPPPAPLVADRGDSEPAGWRALIYGPITDPVLSFGGVPVVEFAMTVPDGSWLDIDQAARTVLLDSEPSASRRSDMVFSGSSWGLLPEGHPTVTLTGSSTSARTRAVVTWRDQWLI